MRKLTVLLAILLVSGLQIALAQTRTVRGTVSSKEDGLKLPGVNVTIKGTTNGTATDINGDYQITVPQDATTLVFSFIGYQTQEIPISSDVINVVLESESKALQEVMVVAYGTTKRESFTGSAASVKTDQIEKVPVASFEQAIAGTVPGVVVGNTSGQPGSFTQIRIRGTGSINSSNEPLYVLDGVPLASGSLTENTSANNSLMSTINPSDIESITILKDAAAASLYGSRAANGVILITTKKGKDGKTTFKFKSELGISDFAYRNFELASSEEAYKLKKEGFYNRAYYILGYDAAASETYSENLMAAAFPSYDPTRPASDYDWAGALFRKGKIQNYEFSASGGDNKTTFYTSFNYFDQLGFSLRSDYKRYSGRLNIDHKANKYISLGVNTNFTNSTQNVVPDASSYYVNPIFATRYYLSQLVPIRNVDGTYNTDIGGGSYPNLVKDLQLNKQRTNMYRSLNKAYINLDIIEGLSARSTFGFDGIFTDEDRYWSPLSNDGEVHNGYASKDHHIYTTLTSSNTVNYNKSLFEVHNIEFLAGYEIEKTRDELTYADGHNFPNAVLPALSNASEPYDALNQWSEKRMASMFAKFGYNYDNKYYASFSYRRDGSSQLGSNNRWGAFWSVSAAWRVTQEKFLQGITWLNDWKLRASYGTNGTLPSDWYGHQAFYGYGYNYNDSPGATITQVYNPDLSWEKNKALNIGTDLKIFGFLTIEAEYYKRKTTDLLLDVPVTLVSGFATTLQNVGEMENKGWEFSVTSMNVAKKDFQWSTNLNLSHNKNEITKLYNGEPITSSPFRLTEGGSYYDLYMRDWAGVDPQTGHGLWYVIGTDGNREKDATTGEYITTDNASACGYRIVGSTEPKLTGGFSNTINYKGIDFSVLFTFKIGGKTYAASQYFAQDDGTNWFSTVDKDYYNNHWQKPGDNAKYPIYIYNNPYQSNYFSSRRVHDADFVRLKTISLGYTLPKKYTSMVGADGLRLYFSAVNLWTWAKDNLYDPEVDARGQYGSTIPPMKTYTFGLELTF